MQRFFGDGEVSLLDLDSGHRRRIAVPGAYFYFAGWQSDGTLVAMTSTTEGSGIARIRDASAIEMAGIAAPRAEPSTEAGDFHIAGDGKTAAIMMTDSLATYWWIPLPRE